MTDEPIAHEGEKELLSDYPIHQGYLYICDGKVWRSDRSTNANTLKITHKFKSIKNCDITSREIWHLAI